MANIFLKKKSNLFQIKSDFGIYCMREQKLKRKKKQIYSTCSKNMVKSSKNSACKILIAESSHRTDKDLVLKQLTKNNTKFTIKT